MCCPPLKTFNVDHRDSRNVSKEVAPRPRGRAKTAKNDHICVCDKFKYDEHLSENSSDLGQYVLYVHLPAGKQKLIFAKGVKVVVFYPNPRHLTRPDTQRESGVRWSYLLLDTFIRMVVLSHLR